MRPAQIAREIRAAPPGAARPPPYFNEARANCAGNWRMGQERICTRRTSMRPAQIAREIGAEAEEAAAEAATSMRPAQIAREIGPAAVAVDGDGVTSMRPAQIAREIPPGLCSRSSTCRHFNEARANCAGN